MFNLLFASGHGGATKEIALLCKHAGIQLSLPGSDTREPLKHLVKDEDGERLGLPVYKTMRDIAQAIRNNEVNGWLVAKPEVMVSIRKHFGDTVPIAARHSVNSFDKYQKFGLNNFISPSRTALKKMGAANQWLSVKARNHEDYDKFIEKRPPVQRRQGFFSYIHHYEQYWKRAYSFFSEVQRQLAGAVLTENYGKDTTGGMVDDHKTMIKSKATLHIKDGQVCCNAPINSICLGIPVLMDYETLERLGMEDYIVHQVSGLLFETPEECVKWISILDQDDAFLEELSRRTLEFARLKCSYTSQDYLQFATFLYRMH